MKIFANENLFEPIIDYLRSLGNDVLSIRDCGLSGISDDEESGYYYPGRCTDKKINKMTKFSTLPHNLNLRSKCSNLSN